MELVLIWVLVVSFELISLNNIVYEGWINSRFFTYVYRGILIITQGHMVVNEHYLWIRLID